MVLLLINSCRKDRQNLPLTKTELITEARSFFENETVNLPKLNDNNVRHSLNKTPLWDKASVRKISIGDAVIVPISYEREIMVAYEEIKEKTELDKTSYLIIYKDKEQNLKMEWITLLPTDERIGGNFMGSLIIEQWNGKFMRGYAFGEGGQITDIEPSGSQIFKKAAYMRSEYCFTVNHYGYISIYGYNGPMQLLGSEKYCIGTSSNGETSKTQGNSDGGGIGPEEYTYTIDCNKELNGTAEWNYDCDACIGGSTGINSCAEITEKIKNECLNGVWLSIKGNLDDKIVSLLHTTFGQNHSINFKVVDGNVDSGAPAKSQVTKNSINSSGEIKFDVKVTLNKNTMPSYSKEFIASTIIHEIMHAYFNANKIHYNQQFQQHQSMAEGYVDSMKDAVQDIFPDLPDSSAYALILNGFNDMFENNLDGWNALLLKYQLSNQEIYDTQISYKSSDQGAPGTKCPPKP